MSVDAAILCNKHLLGPGAPTARKPADDNLFSQIS